MKYKYSIIIPYHEPLDLTLKLLDVLIPQLTNECELCIVDDDVNTYKLDEYKSDRVKVIHHEVNSGGAGKPRNTGIDNTMGEYISFIDSDDMVSDEFVSKILEKINTSDFDYCFYSWEFNGVRKGEKVIIEDEPPGWNCGVVNCIYKRETIGKERFNEEMKSSEDYDFNVRVRKGKKENILNILYFYNDNRKDSLTWKALRK